MFDEFRKLVAGQSPGQSDDDGSKNELGKLAVFSGVSKFPVRVKCATLAWHAMHAALNQQQEAVSTE